MYMFLLRSATKSLYLWSSPILSGCSGRCPWYKPQLPIFPPKGSFTGRSSGDHLTIFLLWCPLFITSNRGSLAWGGAGTPVPCMTAAHTEGNANLWHDKKKPVLVEDSWPSVLVHHFIGGDVSCNLAYHLPSLFFPPILDLPLSLPRHPPSLVPGCQVSSSLHLFFCHSTISVNVLPQLIGPVPPAGCSSICLSQKLHTYPHSWWRLLSWGPCCCQWWERWSWLGA